MRKLLIILPLFFFSSLAFGLALPKEGDFQIKEVADKNILYVVHTKYQGHISNSLIKLIQYYLLQDNDNYEVVFPQLSIEISKANIMLLATKAILKKRMR